MNRSTLIDGRLVALGAVVASSIVLVAAACGAALGETCFASVDCEDGLECVQIDDDKTVCVPRPTQRDERTCDDDNPCSAPVEPVWPVDAECVEGVCKCSKTVVDCFTADDDLSDDKDFVVDPVTCVCRPEQDACADGGTGDACG